MDQLTPIYRIEFFLDTIVNNSANDLDPIYRVEFFLAKIAGREVEIPDPLSRMEMFLAKLCGESVELPEPKSRTEIYLAAICGEDVEVPDPIYRIEYWLSEWAGGWLPSAYKKLVGFTYNNNAYFDIEGFKRRGSDTLRFSFKCTMASPACNVLGAYDGSSAQSNYSLYLGASSSAKYMRYNGGTYRSDADSDTRYDVVITPTGVTGLKADSTWTEKTFESDCDLCIGTTSPSATSSKMVGDIIGSIVVDGRLNLIPCKRVSDNTLGYYDTHSKTFFEPTGSGLVSMGDAE